MTKAGIKRVRLGPITLNERKECIAALIYLLSIGWKKSDLDALERLWWKCRRARREQQRARAGRGDSDAGEGVASSKR